MLDGTSELLIELDIIFKMILGMLAGVAVGWERTSKQKSAGIRTFGLVGLGTAAVAGIFTEPQHADAASRVIQGVVTGIGFLGAGVIILRENETAPRGLTTAAAIWVTAALGCAAGLGHWRIVLTATALALVLLAIDHSVERWAGRRRSTGKDEGGAAQSFGGSEARSKTGTASGEPSGP